MVGITPHVMGVAKMLEFVWAGAASPVGHVTSVFSPSCRLIVYLQMGGNTMARYSERPTHTSLWSDPHKGWEIYIYIYILVIGLYANQISRHCPGRQSRA